MVLNPIKTNLTKLFIEFFESQRALGVILVLVHFYFRWNLMHSPFFSELDYDEAITGLVGLHSIQGEPQLFLWGRARMGALESILAGFLFFLIGTSALAMQLSLVLISTFILILCFFLGSLLGGRSLGLLSAALWALPPIFLSFTSLYAMGGHLEAVAAGAFILYGIGRLLFNPPKYPAIFAGLMGLVAGLGWWSSMLVIFFITTALMSITLSKPRLLISRISLVWIAGFILGSLPFWIWNYHYDFLVFRLLEDGDAGPLYNRIIPIFAQSVIPTFVGTYWDGNTVFPFISKKISIPLLIFYYLPAGVLLVVYPFRWAIRLLLFKKPFQGPMDIIILSIWSFLFFRAFFGAGKPGFTRYTIGLYVPLAVLMGYWLWNLVRFNKTLGVLAFSGLLVFNASTYLSYYQQQKNVPYRPVEALINRLQDLGIKYGYADSRVSQVITFESQEKIICSDFYGMSNYDFLTTVDRAPSREVSIITHKVLGYPYPEVMEASLRLLGCRAKREVVGDYVFWYDFKEPSDPLQPLSPLNWMVSTSDPKGNAKFIFDRDISAAWKVTKKAGVWLMVDIGKTARLSRISLLPDPRGMESLSGIKLELSLDGKNWNLVKKEGHFIAGLNWFQKRPRLFYYPRLQIAFPPQPARYLRLTNLNNPDNPTENLSVAQLFIYEAAQTPYQPSEEALQAYKKAQEAMDHWMDDPTGPHPQFYNIPSDHRRKQVYWNTVINSVNLAIQSAPDWEEPYYLFGEALNLLNVSGNLKLDYRNIYPLGRLIPSSSWKVSANFNNQQAHLAADNNPNTRWTTLKPQESGMLFEVDIGMQYPIKKLSLLLGNSVNDYPRKLAIQVSQDNINWQELKANPSSAHYVTQDHLVKRIFYTFPSTTFRFIRLSQLGKDPEMYWSIHELEIFRD